MNGHANKSLMDSRLFRHLLLVTLAVLMLAGNILGRGNNLTMAGSEEESPSVAYAEVIE